MEMRQGVLYGVGVGPGDPELLTLKALRTLERCPVIAAPRTRGGEMLALDIVRRATPLEHKTILPLDFTMSRYGAVMVPGVPSFCAVAARLGTSLTTAASPLHILPASRDTLAEQLELPGTKVLMKSGRQLPQVAELLERKGLLEKAAMVRDCGLPTEQVCQDLTRLPEDAGYFATVIVKE